MSDFLEAAIEQEAAEPETLEHSLQAKAEEAAVEQTAVEEKEPLVGETAQLAGESQLHSCCMMNEVLVDIIAL